MKKILKGNLKRWIAFLLAVVLIATTCVYSSDAFLRAEGDETQAENQAEPASEEVEVIPTEVNEPEQDPEPEAEESNEEETEEETEEEPVEEDVVEIPAEAPEEPDVNPEETTTPEVLPESPETTPEQPADPSVSPAIDPSASPSVSPSAVPSASPEKEEGEVYSYTICYYYDGVEDEDARVEKEDGVLGEKILASVKVEGEVTVDGKDYKLDKIENKNGEITEDGDNTVKIYYESVDGKEIIEDVKEYSFEIVEPSKGATVSITSVDGEEGKKENTYKENTKVTFEVEVDEGYMTPLVRDQKNSEVESVSADEENRKYTYTVTITENTVVTVSCAMAFGAMHAPKKARDGDPTTYKIIYMYAPEGTIDSGKEIGSVTINGYVGEAVSGDAVSREYTSVTDGEYVYTTKGGSFIIGDEAEPDWVDGQSIGIKLGSDPVKNIIYVIFASREPVSKVVSIHFETNGGTPVNSMKGEAGISILNRGMPETIKEGFVLEGWYSNESLTGNKITELPEVYPNEDITYYAKWKEKEKPKVKLVYDANGGEGSAPSAVTVESGMEVTVADKGNLHKTGYEFDGWNTQADGNGNAYSVGASFTLDKDVTLYAQWKPNKNVSYTVHYYLQGTEDKVAEDKTETGKTFDVSYTETAVDVAGYTLVGDKTQTFTLDEEGKEITFYYTADEAKIVFVTNGGSGVDDMDGATGEKISDRAMPETVRTGYEFGGWYADAGLTGDKVEELPESYPAGTTTYYASWAANINTQYTVQYHYQNPLDGSYSDEEPEKKTATTDTSVSLTGKELLPTLTLESGRYIFDESDSRNILEGNVAGDGSLKLHVYFPIEYTINGRIDHGTVTESNQNVRYAAASSAMSFTAERNYVIKSIMVNGEEQTVTPNQMTYTYPAQSDIKEDIEVQVTTEEMKAELTLTKTRTNEPANKTGYVLGEAIEYKIVAKNTGNLTLNNVIVKDALVNGTWTIQGNLEPNEEREFTASYTVREDDIKAKEVVNTVTAEVPGLGPDYPKPDIIPGEDKAPVDVPTPSLYVEKVASGNDVPGKKYEEGEVVTYTIKVINNGNVTISNIVVEDPLTGMVWDVGTLVPSDNAIPLIRKPSKEKDTKYTIKPDDILAGKVVNTVTVSGVDPDGNPVDTTDTETIRTNDVRTDYSVAKEITSSSTHADGTYHVGDTIEYKITITSDANVVLENVRIADQLSNATDVVVFTGFDANKVTIGTDNVATITELVPGETVTLNCEYTVTRQDALLNAGLVDAGIRNSASVTADPVQPTNPDDPNPKPVPEKETDPVGPAAVERVYTLTVNYVYEAGGIAATSVIGQYLAGEIYRVDSPVIDGYTRADFVAGQMPNNDLVLTVVYAAVATPPAPGGDPAPDPVDPDTPPVPPVTPVDEVPDPVVPPVVPEGPAVPEAPVVPGTPETVLITAPAAPALVAVGDAPVPLQGALIETDDDGNVTVTPITEEEIPLANKEIDDHKCCIMSFLLMLATLIIYSWFTHSMKKRQKKLAELKDQLAEETLKRQLGITDKTSNRR